MRLPAKHLLFSLLQVVPLGGAPRRSGAGSGDFPKRRRKALRRVRTGFRASLQSGQVLPRLCREGTQAAKDRKRAETEVGRGQIGPEKALCSKVFQTPFRGGRYLVSSTPENELLTVHMKGGEWHSTRFYGLPSTRLGLRGRWRRTTSAQRRNTPAIPTSTYREAKTTSI